MTAAKDRPSRSASTSTGRAATSGSGSRSSPTSGAPMVETTATRSSSARDSAGMTTGRNPRAASARRFRSEWYGFPPPPAPRIQAPAARSSISVGVSSRAPGVMRPAMLADRADADVRPDPPFVVVALPAWSVGPPAGTRPPGPRNRTSLFRFVASRPATPQRCSALKRARQRSAGLRPASRPPRPRDRTALFRFVSPRPATPQRCSASSACGSGAPASGRHAARRAARQDDTTA